MPFFRPLEPEPYSVKSTYLRAKVLTQPQLAFFHGISNRRYNIVVRGRRRRPLLTPRSLHENAAASLAGPHRLFAVSFHLDSILKGEEAIE